MHEVALSLGTNSGDRGYYLAEMECAVSQVLSDPVIKSSVYETEPLEVSDPQPWFLNRIISGFYEGTPMDLLMQCQTVESQLGRTGKGMRTARTADIDILLFGRSCISTQNLTIPHPALFSRRFCLEGLNDVLSEFIIPTTGKAVAHHHQNMAHPVQQQKLRILSGEESG